MLEHQKNILAGVSSDKVLFRQELIKSMSLLNDMECKQIIKWVNENFALTHNDVIREVLYPDWDYQSYVNRDFEDL